MNSNLQTSKAYFRFLTIIYSALISGQLIFGLVAYYLSLYNPIEVNNPELREVFLYVVPILIFMTIAAAILIFRIRIRKIKTKTDIIEKLTDYRAVIITSYGLLEGPSLFSIIAYIITGDLLFLAFSGFIILIFLSIRPTREKTETELDLNSSEKAKLHDPNAYIAELQTGRC